MAVIHSPEATLDERSKNMIISEDDANKKAAARSPASAVFADAAPPTYLSSVGANQHPSSSQTPPPVPPKTSPSAPIGIKPTNHLLITRKHDSLKETICIDPGLVLPAALLPPLEPGQSERENLRVESTNGSVSLDIWVVSGNENFNPNVRTVLFVKSVYGNITAQLHAPGSPRPPIHFTVANEHGSVQVHLPRSFTGPILITTGHGSVKISDAVRTQLTPLGETKDDRRYFIGDLSTWSDPNADWNGDELVVRTTYGGIKVHYEDGGEPISAPIAASSSTSNHGTSKQGGFFRRVFAA